MKKINIELKKYKRRDLILPIAIMAAMLVGIFVVVSLLDRAERMTVEDPLYQFVFEEADNYTEGITMKREEDAIMIDNGVQIYESNGVPFYYKEKYAMLLTDDFLCLGRNGELLGKLPYFTNLEMKDGAFVPDNLKDVALHGGMMHDGKDVYIFLEDTEVSWNGKTQKIGAFSYVSCFQGEEILIYNYGGDVISDVLEGDGASALMENGIEVDLVNDVYYKANGTKHLLFSEPAVFDPVK